MKVFVIGANGQVGQQLISLLKESDEHTPRAMVRKEEQAAAFEKSGIETVIADLEDSVEKIMEAAKGSDAIVFTAGSGGSTGQDKTLLVDLDGAAKTVEAAEKAGIKRFVMVSAIQAHNRENWKDTMKPYFAAKHHADKVLEQSDLTYTIVRPGGLTNDPGTGKITAAENLERSTIAREDVARTILAALGEEKTFNRAFDLVNGDEPIPEAIKNI